MRLYQPIWDSLKVNKEVTILASPEAHARIRKAVKKEKWSDVAFKFSEDGKRLELKIWAEGNKLHFKLQELAPSATKLAALNPNLL